MIKWINEQVKSTDNSILKQFVHNDEQNECNILKTSVFLGNDNLYNILNSRSYTLRFDLEDWNGDVRYAEYSTFRIADESDNYRLTIGGYKSASTVRE